MMGGEFDRRSFLKTGVVGTAVMVSGCQDAGGPEVAADDPEADDDTDEEAESGSEETEDPEITENNGTNDPENSNETDDIQLVPENTRSLTAMIRRGWVHPERYKQEELLHQEGELINPNAVDYLERLAAVDKELYLENPNSITLPSKEHTGLMRTHELYGPVGENLQFFRNVDYIETDEGEIVQIGEEPAETDVIEAVETMLESDAEQFEDRSGSWEKNGDYKNWKLFEFSYDPDEETGGGARHIYGVKDNAIAHIEAMKKEEETLGTTPILKHEYADKAFQRFINTWEGGNSWIDDLEGDDYKIMEYFLSLAQDKDHITTKMPFPYEEPKTVEDEDREEHEALAEAYLSEHREDHVATQWIAVTEEENGYDFVITSSSATEYLDSE